MKKIKIGFLPLYVKLYDEVVPETRNDLTPYLIKAQTMMEDEGFDLVKAPICCVASEFKAAVDMFNSENVDAIVTLHLAYSPSLESIEALLLAKAPIVVLDSTVCYNYAEEYDVANLMANHGIHGVQDMTCLLRKYGKTYFVEAGHLDHSDVVSRVGDVCRALSAAKALKGSKVGIVGEPFDGMGDFRITSEKLLSDFGVELVEFDLKNDAPAIISAITKEEIDAEIESDKQNYIIETEIDNDYIESTKANLMLRKWAEKTGLSAFTVNFLAITKDSGIPRMTFMEACKGMARGLGYAGEGDVLTAAIVGSLLSAFEGTTFAEMFCPSWNDDLVFLSHMGEMNTALCAEKPVISKMKFEYTDAGYPVFSWGRFKAGKAVYFNVSPSQDGFDFILFPIEMVDKGGSDKMKATIEGWFKPEMPINDFLKKYSEAGGTHHGGFIYDASVESLVAYAKQIGLNPVVIK